MPHEVVLTMNSCTPLVWRAIPPVRSVGARTNSSCVDALTTFHAGHGLHRTGPRPGQLRRATELSTTRTRRGSPGGEDADLDDVADIAADLYLARTFHDGLLRAV